jgi:hypothetical protein
MQFFKHVRIVYVATAKLGFVRNILSLHIILYSLASDMYIVYVQISLCDIRTLIHNM